MVIIESMSRAKEEEKGARYTQKEEETWKIKDIVGEFKESTSRHFRFLLFGELRIGYDWLPDRVTLVT